ncbi:MAG: hypothetical protein ABIO49_15090 [Dokdonella sp.]
MTAARLLSFYISAILALGTVGFFGNLLSDWLMFGRNFWTGDALFTWLVAVVATAVFILVACLPLQILAKRFAFSGPLLGALAGPLFVWLLLAVRHEPLSVRNYVSAPGVISLHLIFVGLGLLFAVAYRRCRPDNSFKRTLLRSAT